MAHAHRVALILAWAFVFAQEPDIEAAAAAWARDTTPAMSANAPSTPRPQRPRSRQTPRRVRSRPRRLRAWSRVADLTNGAMLIMSAPLALRGGIGSVAALRNVLLGSWLSGFGALLIVVEARLPIIHYWLRRNARILTSNVGRLLLLLCASTMSLASGPMGAILVRHNSFPGDQIRRTTKLEPTSQCDRVCSHWRMPSSASASGLPRRRSTAHPKSRHGSLTDSLRLWRGRARLAQ